jgi:hypothetical protein
MTWDQSNWDSGTWDQPSDYFSPQPKSKTKMKRQDYYPSRIGDQVNWLDNYAAKLPIHGAVLGVIAADITASVNDAKYANYVLGTWLTAVRAFHRPRRMPWMTCSPAAAPRPLCCPPSPRQPCLRA